jgi:hypothetical protein
MQGVTEQAIAAIGTDDPGADWRLAPQAHAATLPPQAGALRRVLEQAELRKIAGEFEVADRLAVKAQQHYKRAARARLYAGVTATIIGATFVLPVEAATFVLPIEVWTGWLASVASAVQCIAFAISVLTLLHLIRAKPFDIWMKARARAEVARIKLFDEVLRGVDRDPQPGELPLLPLQLEYFRRYQLDMQQRYYADRGAQHARAAGQTVLWQIQSFALSAFAGVVATAVLLKSGLQHGLQPPDWLTILSDSVSRLPDWTNRVVLMTGIIASAVFGASVSRSLMDLDERNASRYLTNADNLKFFAETDLAAARAAAAAGDAGTVNAFVEEIQRLVSSEHQEWLLFRDAVPGSMRKGTVAQVR